MHKLGYITSRTLSEWLNEVVGFKLNDFEIKLIFNRYDKKSLYTINLGEFIEEVSQEINPEEYENNEDQFAEGEANDDDEYSGQEMEEDAEDENRGDQQQQQ